MKPRKAFEPQSRRRFLKFAGTALASGAVVQSWPTEAAAELPKNDVSPEELAAANAIVKQSQLFLYSIERLKEGELSLQHEPVTPNFGVKQGDLIGLVYHCIRPDTLRMQADMIATVDLSDKSIVATQLVTGWGLVDMLLVTSWTYSEIGTQSSEVHVPHSEYYVPDLVVYSPCGHNWNFPQIDARPSEESELVSAGWPPETEDKSYWHFDGTLNIMLDQVGDIFAFRSATVRESKNAIKPTTVEFTLDYSLPDWSVPEGDQNASR